MQTLKDYVTGNLTDIDDALVITMEDSAKDVIEWLLHQENKETLIGMINAMDSNNKL